MLWVNIGRQIRLARKNKGLSQVELASRSGVGVATVQNIERNRANPELQTLLALFKVLKMRLRIEAELIQPDWDEVVAYGCPIMAARSFASSPGLSRRRLIEILEQMDFSELAGRQAAACAAWLHAIRDHYPSVWREIPAVRRAWASNRIVEPKLRRLALAKLGSYL